MNHKLASKHLFHMCIAVLNTIFIEDPLRIKKLQNNGLIKYGMTNSLETIL